MTTPQDVGGLPELPKFGINECVSGITVQGYTADQMRAYGEQCRATPNQADSSSIERHVAAMEEIADHYDPASCAAPKDGRTRYPECSCDTEHGCQYGATLRAAGSGEGEEFRKAVIDQLVIAHIYRKEHDTDPHRALNELIDWHVSVALDPRVSEAARKLAHGGGAGVE